MRIKTSVTLRENRNAMASFTVTPESNPVEVCEPWPSADFFSIEMPGSEIVFPRPPHDRIPRVALYLDALHKEINLSRSTDPAGTAKRTTDLLEISRHLRAEVNSTSHFEMASQLRRSDFHVDMIALCPAPSEEEEKDDFRMPRINGRITIPILMLKGTEVRRISPSLVLISDGDASANLSLNSNWLDEL